jgi:hypothetical protein
MAMVTIVALTLGGVRWGSEMKQRRDKYLQEALYFGHAASAVESIFWQVPPNTKVAAATCDEKSQGASYEYRPGFPGLNREELAEKYRFHAEGYKRIELAYRWAANFPWVPPPVFELPPRFCYYAGVDLRLISSPNDISALPSEGKNLVIVAAVNYVLHFRIFDENGKVILDTDETKLTKQAREIEDLKKQLESLWPPNEITGSDKDRIIYAVTYINRQ